MLRCKHCKQPYDIDDYTDTDTAADDCCPDCYNSGAYLDSEEEEFNDEFNPDEEYNEEDDDVTGYDEEEYVPDSEEEEEFPDEEEEDF